MITDDTSCPVWQWPYSAFGDNKPTGVLTATTSATSAYTQDSASLARLQATTPALTYNPRYPGQYFDTESNLSYNTFRSYNSAQGRYTQGDPIGLDGGLSRFAYVGGNALGYSDPNGLFAQTASVYCGPYALFCAAGITGALALSTPEGRQTAVEVLNKVIDTCTPDNKDPSEEIRRQIRDLQAKLAAKESQLSRDQFDLYNRARSVNPGGDLAGKGTYAGHVTQIEGLRIGLAKKIAQARVMGCM